MSEKEAKTSSFFKGIFEKWSTTIILSGVTIFGTAVWDYWNRFYVLPERMDAWEARAKRDSLHYAKIIEDNTKYDRLQDEDIYRIEDTLMAVKKRVSIFTVSEYGGIE